MSHPSTSVRFTEEDLQLFSAASGDRNPLHLAEDYAARTSYGARVVFGALGAVAALGRLPQNRRPRSIKAEFLRPMFLGVDYTVQAEPRGEDAVVRLLDGSVAVVSLTVAFDPSPAEMEEPRAGGPVFEQTEALSRSEDDIAPGLAVHGRYRADPDARERLRLRWGAASTLALDALLWASYFVGMVLPGRSALFFRFTAAISGLEHDGLFAYEAEVRHVDKRLGQARIGFRLSVDAQSAAEGECVAFLRPSPPPLDVAVLEQELPPGDALAGKVALVTGASRGLGAALARAFASQSATVLACSRSPQPASNPRELPGSIVPVQGEFADTAWREALSTRIAGEHGRLDFLVCNAFPPIAPLVLEPNAFSRLHAYIAASTDLVLGPLCSFAALLNNSRGALILVSSIAVEHPVREWPHYVAAKRAAEALAEVAALQYPNIGVLIARPEKLLTEMTNTPLGRRNALRPEIMAARIVRRVAAGLSAGASEILR